VRVYDLSWQSCIGYTQPQDLYWRDSHHDGPLLWLQRDQE
jgi:hypothetical protein